MEDLLSRVPRPRLFSISAISHVTEDSLRERAAQVDQGFKKFKEMCTILLEIVLRLPGLILLELLWRYQDVSFEKMSDDMIKKVNLSYIDVPTMLDFVHRRNFDHSAAIILSYCVIFLSLMFLTLPLIRLARMYSHFISLVAFGFAYKLSAIYVELELDSGESEVKLDSLIRLERHGFHLLSQICLALLNCYLLEMEGEPWKMALTVFAAPIVSRMAGYPLDKLKNVHNYSSTGAMLFISTYILFRGPNLIKSAKIAFRQIKSIFLVHGLAQGSITVWKRLRLAELMTFTWLTMFSMCLYVEVVEKSRPWNETGKILLAGIAEATSTPISLLALAITVSYVSAWVANLAQMIIGGHRNHTHVLSHAGYTESFTLVILCVQTGWLGMRTEEKTLLLGVVLFIVISALLQSLYELIEPELLNLASSLNHPRSRHIRCLSLTLLLIIVPFCVTHAIIALLPLQIWSVIVLANSLTVALHSIAALLRYCILVVDAKSDEPWERCDDLTFYVDFTTKIFELVISKAVMVFGCMDLSKTGINFATIVILVFHVVVNIYRRIENMFNSLKNRNAAVSNINKLSRADAKQLKERQDVCAICFMEMKEEARITPCKHFFHGPCLRKWLAVKMVCPLCYTEMKPDVVLKKQLEPEQQEPQNGEILFDWEDVFNFQQNDGNRSERYENRLHNARDMWPLQQNDQPYDSDSSIDTAAESEYTVQSADDE